MNSKRNELRVGIAVLVSLVILIGGVMWAKGFSLRAKRYVIHVIFDNVGGLEKGGNVLANGVVRGRVSDIQLREGKVWVKAAVDKSVTLYSDYSVVVESPTIMAGKALSINPGTKLPPADITVPLIGESPLGMTEAVNVFQDISTDLRGVLRNLDTLIVSLNHIAADSMNQARINSMVLDASEVARKTNDWISTNSDDMTGAIGRLETTLAAAEAMVKNSGEKLSGTLSNADSAAIQVASLSAELHEIMAKINSREGTIGKLIYDDEVYLRLNRTLAQVDSLAYSIRTKGMRQRIVLF